MSSMGIIQWRWPGQEEGKGEGIIKQPLNNEILTFWFPNLHATLRVMGDQYESISLDN